MAYDVAIAKGWLELGNLTEEKNLSINFLNDEYSVDSENKRILSLSCNVPTKEYVTILLLHYLIQRLKSLPLISGEWISFRQLEGGEGYYPVFKKRVIGTILRKYKSKPEALFELTKRFGAKRIQLADVGVILDVFEGVPILIEMWKGDDEFGPEVNVLFDRNITNIFCTEDIVVLAEFIAHQI